MSGGGALVLLILLSAVVSGPATIVVRAANSPAEQAFAALQGTDVVEPAPRRQISPEQLQEIEAGLLKMFGLSSRPRPPKGKVHIPPYLLELYNNHVSNPHRTSLNFKVSNLDTLSANTIRSFFHKEPHRVARSANEQRRVQRHVLRFNVSSVGDHEDLTAAELRLYREGNQSDSLSDRIPHRISIYEVVRPGSRHREPITRLIDTRVVDSRHTEWESFDVSPAVSKWHKSPHLNHGLEVHVSAEGATTTDNKHVRLRRSVSSSDGTWQTERPLLVTYSDDRQADNSRTRRSSRKKRKRSRDRDHRPRRRRLKNQCQRHELFVDFEEVGWNDWIVAPPGYEAFYCTGECTFPFAEHMNATNHAIVQTLVNSIDPTAVPKACCVPTELTPISMLYLDEFKKVVLKNYQGMVVRGCGCR